MRPMFKVMMGVLVLILLLFSYSMTQSLKSIGGAAHSLREARMLPTLVQNACFSYLMEYNQFPPPDNQRLAAALLGENSRRVVFITLPKGALNTKGEIVDRWGTPLKITIKGNSEVQVISAGPDREFGTADDIYSAKAGDPARP